MERYSYANGNNYISLFQKSRVYVERGLDKAGKNYGCLAGIEHYMRKVG